MENRQGSLAEVGVTYPAVLLTDIPEFRPTERSLSRGHVRGSCSPGDRYPAKEGLKFIDQSGKLCVITRAVIKEVGGPAIRNALNIALTWIGLGLRIVITDLEVQCEESIDVARAKTLIVPLAENRIRTTIFTTSTKSRRHVPPRN